MSSEGAPFLTKISKNPQGRFSVLNGMKPGSMGKTVPKPKHRKPSPLCFAHRGGMIWSAVGRRADASTPERRLIEAIRRLEDLRSEAGPLGRQRSRGRFRQARSAIYFAEVPYFTAPAN